MGSCSIPNLDISITYTIYILYIYICKTNKSRSDDWADPVEETLLFLHGERTFHSSLGNCRWDSK